ncbi:MAG: hypothetical protein ACREIU_03955, partial [Planctomycetota bacterium]
MMGSSAGSRVFARFLLAGIAGGCALARPGPPRPSPPPPPAETRDGRWRQDVAYLAAELPKIHGNLFRSLRQEDFDRAIADLDAAIPRIGDDAVAAGLA